MPRLPHALLVPLLLVVGCGPPASSALTVAHAAAISDSVKETFAAFRDRLNAADQDSLIRFYLDDPRFLLAADGRVGTHSVAEVRAQFKSMSGFPRWHIEYIHPVIVPLAPGAAEVVTEYTMSLVDSAGTPLTFGGANTMIWVASPRGWKIIGGHGSSTTLPHP